MEDYEVKNKRIKKRIRSGIAANGERIDEKSIERAKSNSCSLRNRSTSAQRSQMDNRSSHIAASRSQFT